MNEYDRLHRQAQRYKELYPKGTRILLLHMGDDPRPVEDDMRGTVMFVDDTSTVHCKFDNGRQLGLMADPYFIVNSFQPICNKNPCEKTV